MRALILFFFMVTSGCHFASDQVRKNFKTVDSSIERSMLVPSQRADVDYERIRTHRDKNPRLAAKADTLYSVTAAAIGYAEVLKERLLAMDSIGEKMAPARQLLVHTAASDSMLKHMSAAARYAYVGLTGPGKVDSLDGILRDIHDCGRRDWTIYYFGETPTVAALTILSKFQSDCRNASALTLEDISTHF